MRFLTEDPWERLALLREKAPEHPDPDAAARRQRRRLHQLSRQCRALFRVAAPRARAWTCSASSTASTGSRTCASRSTRSARPASSPKGAICYTGDILDPTRDQIFAELLRRPRQGRSSGRAAISSALKDMAGLLKPAAARVLVKALREEVGLPIHLHTHDTSGIAAASVLAAVEAGVDAIDAAMDSMSGTTSQPCLGSIVEALRHTDRDTGLDPEAIRRISFYWEAVRAQYAAFENNLKSGASEVYLHEMPGGQFTNLKEQARSLGLETRWHEVAKAYRAVNDMFGDIVKVTPSSKVVGDMALMMVSARADAERRARSQARDRLPGIGRRNAARRSRPAARRLAGSAAEEGAEGRDADRPRVPARCCRTRILPAQRADAEKRIGRQIDDAGTRVLSDVSEGVRRLRRRRAQVRAGLRAADADLLLRHAGRRRERASASKRASRWWCGCRRSAKPTRKDRSASSSSSTASRGWCGCPTAPPSASLPVRRKAEEGNDAHVAAPMPGAISTIAIRPGQTVKAGDLLLTHGSDEDGDLAFRSARRQGQRNSGVVRANRSTPRICWWCSTREASAGPEGGETEAVIGVKFNYLSSVENLFVMRFGL